MAASMFGCARAFTTGLSQDAAITKEGGWLKWGLHASQRGGCYPQSPTRNSCNINASPFIVSLPLDL